MKGKKWYKLSIVLFIVGIFFTLSPVVSTWLNPNPIETNYYLGDPDTDGIIDIPPPSVVVSQWPLLFEIIGILCFIGSTFSALKYKKVI